jgi:hypothetical protein
MKISSTLARATLVKLASAWTMDKNEFFTFAAQVLSAMGDKQYSAKGIKIMVTRFGIDIEFMFAQAVIAAYELKQKQEKLPNTFWLVFSNAKRTKNSTIETIITYIRKKFPELLVTTITHAISAKL